MSRFIVVLALVVLVTQTFFVYFDKFPRIGYVGFYSDDCFRSQLILIQEQVSFVGSF